MSWDRFTERARHLVEAAKRAGSERGVADIGDEHFLFALLGQDESMALWALESLGVDLILLQDEARSLLPSDHPPSSQEPWLASRGKIALQLAKTEAELMGQNWIGTEHLLLGLVADEGGNASQLLAKHGVVSETAREAVRRIPGQNRSRD